MIKVAALYLTTGVALVVAVAAAVGVAWIAVAIPVLISTAAGYGLFALGRRWKPRGADTRSEKSHRMRA
jgi:hypothetical protein